MTRPLRFGILGCARIARRGMIAGIQRSSVARLEAIASRQAETAQAWAAEFGIPKHYDSYDALIADPDVDAIYNPLPNELHREWTLKAAAQGKHVLCEKPLGLDYTDAQAIVAGCQAAGVILMEAFMWRHHPRVARARQLLTEGVIGELRLVKMDFSFTIDAHDWRLDPRRGGGALYDLGCYGINAARLFAESEPEEIHAHARFHSRAKPDVGNRGPEPAPSSGVDMTTAVELRFPGGVLGLFDCSFECPYRNRLEVVGTKGVLELPDGVLPTPVSELLLRTDASTEIFRFDEAHQYLEQVKAFCAGIASGKLHHPAEDGLANMRALDMALHAARKSGQ